MHATICVKAPKPTRFAILVVFVGFGVDFTLLREVLFGEGGLLGLCWAAMVCDGAPEGEAVGGEG
jgi:hypothetical protein